MKRAPDWASDGRDWPHRQFSRFVEAAGLRWHVQVMGSGPAILLIHGTGAATHSWRGMAERLARQFTIVAPDLPGHGFTGQPNRPTFSLPMMASSMAALMAELNIRPDFVVGHSAGAAIGLRMILDQTISPRRIISLSGALVPFPGSAGIVFPALAKLLFVNPLVAPLIAWRASDQRAVARVIAGTGSHLDAEGLNLYWRLLQTRRHIEATMGLMANWDLWPLLRELPGLPIPLTLVAPERDLAVPPRVASRVKGLVRQAEIITIPGRGHLAHEEDPAGFSDLVIKTCV
jgi:magnesium chelatase accessory protein